MNMLLRCMRRGDLTVHGFRSCFRDWCAEATAHPREVAEQALAHALPDKVEAAYRRGDMVEKWRRLMEEWADVCQAAPLEGVEGAGASHTYQRHIEAALIPNLGAVGSNPVEDAAPSY